MIQWKFKFIKIISFLIITQIIFNSPLFAQGLDTDLLNSLNRQNGSATPSLVVQSPLDQARQAEYTNQLDEQLRSKISAPHL